jgi:uncharacterized DUF497 family protein
VSGTASGTLFLSISILDDEHSEHEKRWVSMGKDRRGSVLILTHTFLPEYELANPMS